MRPRSVHQAAVHFHHLHLNSSNPAEAVAYYARAFGSVSTVAVAGFQGFVTTSRLSERPGNIRVLFDKVGEDALAGASGQSAVAHIGWNVPNARRYLEQFRGLKLEIIPMYADPEHTIDISSDALPGYLTTQQIADARAKGASPTGKGGFLYTRGPDGVLIESYGDFPAERFTHIHMYHRDPICAQQWYARHLGATVAATHLHLGPGQTGAASEEASDPCKRRFAQPTYPAFTKDGRVREPSGYVLFDDIGLPMWPYEGELVSSLGHAVDHLALSVAELEPLLTRLRRSGVRVIEDIHGWGRTRAALIEGPDRIALELVEDR
jgi:catechol 2,3-dioxygenase-like lactoylglutathione lyase family enzyme